MKVSLNMDMTPGGSYGLSTHCRVYASIAEAKEAFWRICTGERISDGSKFVGYLYLGKAIRDCTDLYPDRMLTIGRRGGVRMQEA